MNKKLHPSLLELWNYFMLCNQEHKNAPIPEFYYFCDNEKDANDCAQLVVDGVKRATSTSMWWFETYKQPLPKIGDLAIVTDCQYFNAVSVGTAAAAALHPPRRPPPQPARPPRPAAPQTRPPPRPHPRPRRPRQSRRQQARSPPRWCCASAHWCFLAFLVWGLCWPSQTSADGGTAKTMPPESTANAGSPGALAGSAMARNRLI